MTASSVGDYGRRIELVSMDAHFHDTHTGGALSVGLGLTLSTTGPSGAFTMICRPGPAGGARTDRSGGRDLIGALS